MNGEREEKTVEEDAATSTAMLDPRERCGAVLRRGMSMPREWRRNLGRSLWNIIDRMERAAINTDTGKEGVGGGRIRNERIVSRKRVQLLRNGG